jgi:dCMP deaminase
MCATPSVPAREPSDEASSGDFLAQLSAALEARPGRPSWDEYFMATALLMASRSACERLHVGCVLVSGGEHRNRIIAAGYNGFLPGNPHLSRVRDGHEQATVHAEQNAVADAARRGISLSGATAYITHFPCINCAKILAAAGVRVIKYHVDYRNDPIAAQLLAESGIALSKL